MTPHESPTRPYRRLAFAAVGLAAAALLLGSAESAAAAEIMVDETCSLGEAIEAANSNIAFDTCEKGDSDGVDVITFDAPGAITAPSGGFKIKSNMKIDGHAGGTTITGGGGFVIVVADGTIGLAMKVTLANMRVTGSSGAGVKVEDKAVGSVQGNVRDIAVTLRSLKIDHNGTGVEFTATDYQSGLGGTIKVEDSEISDNSNHGVKLSACQRNPKTVVVENSVVKNNGRNSIQGGGIDNKCLPLKIIDSLIVGNRGEPGGGIYSSGGVGAVSGEVMSSRTEVVNSTITDNGSTDASKRPGKTGGGIYVETKGWLRPEVVVRHSTIAGNRASRLGVGGIQTYLVEKSNHRDPIRITIVNSVVADNAGAQCAFNEGAAITRGHNASPDRRCGFAVTERDVGLGELADNGGVRRIGPHGRGGYVPTMAIDKNSPLFNKAGEANCNAPKDARGATRPQNGGCDIGAYEAKYVEFGGAVWADKDADRRRDEREGPIKGVAVQLRGARGAAAGEKTTNAAGEYRFEVLLPGTWTVRVAGANKVLSGHRATTSKSVKRTVAVGSDDVLDVDFGYQPLARFGGMVWEDSDRDGVRDSGERGVKGVRVTLRQNGSPLRSERTNAKGFYSFSDVVPGSYEVVIERPAGYLHTVRRARGDSDVNPSSGRSAVFELVSGVNEVSANAGVYRPAPSPPKPPEHDPPTSPAPSLSLVKSAEAKAPVKAGDPISYSFLVRNAGNVTLSQITVADPKAGKVSCPGTVLAPEKSMTCTATYKASAADVKAGKVANTATVSAAADGEKVSAAGSATFDLKEGRVSVGRLAGKDRYATAAVISKETFTPGVGSAYVATGVNFPDALAGSAASGGSGPILLVTKDSIPGATVAELKRLKPKRIVVLGGTGVVSASVESKLKAYGKTSRQAGSDRYSTAAAISAAHFEPGAATAYVATGADFPDALTGGPAAAKLGGPILLTQKDKLAAATVSELKRLKPKQIVVLGGTGVVAPAVEKALAAQTSGKVSRLAGTDRYSTGAAISKGGFNPGVPVVYVATGVNFPDALAGGAAGALKGGPVLLVSGGTIPKATKNELTRLKPKQVVVLGGTAVVPESVEKALAAYLR